ncbi:MAG: glutamate 5-kinase [Candidatus Caenarcaniphilales bacterium]|nr:glutamate 5-kinase [Candidatus Caenarcaniphilales bacterium]
MKLVLKIGTSSITGSDPNGISAPLVESTVDLIADLKSRGHQVVLVSSGAVGLGCKQLGFSERPKTVTSIQAAASVGQNLLTNVYQEFFQKYNQTIGQVLLTRRGLQDKERYLNARLTIRELLKLDVIPIINENDAVADDEIKFSDNDCLSALVSELIAAEHLFIVTDIEGLFTEDPRKNPNAKLIEIVEEIDFDLQAKAGISGTQWGTGGMASKIQAAKMATSFGTTVHILSGKNIRLIRDILNGKSYGTTFLPRNNPEDARKAWIAFGAHAKGKVYVDEGALHAIQKGGSLLPVGIKKVKGHFGRGAALEIAFEENSQAHVVAIGITKYRSEDLNKIAGHLSDEIQQVLGYSYGNSAIHCDDLVVLTANEN